MTKKIYLLFLWILLPGLLLAQDKVIVKGKITDGADGSTLPGVSIQIKGTSVGTTSDVEGNYALSAEPGSSFVFSFIGFKTIEEQVGSRTTIDVQLQPESTQLNDVIVVGYGTQEKKDITGAIASINNKDFANQPTTNLAGNLQGKLAGVNVTSTSGTPGAGLAVSVRGAFT
jgi:TonB-dependent starch-binding outer membrane protein SusC